MSKYLLTENILYRTKLSKDEAIKRLAENIEKVQTLSFGINNYTYSKTYIGNLNKNTFEIRRAIKYNNSFLPVIQGEVINDYEGTKIKMKMKPQSAILSFMVLWFIVVLFVSLITVFLLYTKEFTIFFLIPFIMLVFGIVVPFVAFKKESRISRNDFKRILEAKIE